MLDGQEVFFAWVLMLSMEEVRGRNTRIRHQRYGSFHWVVWVKSAKI